MNYGGLLQLINGTRRRKPPNCSAFSLLILPSSSNHETVMRLYIIISVLHLYRHICIWACAIILAWVTIFTKNEKRFLQEFGRALFQVYRKPLLNTCTMTFQHIHSQEHVFCLLGIQQASHIHGGQSDAAAIIL